MLNTSEDKKEAVKLQMSCNRAKTNVIDLNLESISELRKFLNELEKQILNINDVKVNDQFINNRNGGQKVTVTDIEFQGMRGVIGYKLHDHFRFNSLQFSHCPIESFRLTFSNIETK